MTASSTRLPTLPVTAGDVDAVVLHRVHVPLLTPFVAAHGREDDRQVVLVEAVGADGTSGWGECSALSRPTYTPEHTAGAWAVLRDDLVPAVLAGRDVDPAGAPMAWTGLATALVDLHLRREGRSLAEALGGTRWLVPSTAVVGQQPDVAALLAAVGEAVARGHRSVKVKIGPGVDVARLAAVRERHPDLPLAADANGSYRTGEAAHRRALRDLDTLGLVYVEQPLPADDVAGLARLAGGWSTPVAVDESVGGEADVARLAATGSPFVLNLKPARVGGLDESARCLAAAAAAGWPAFVGGMLETGVGRALALAVASWPACTLPADLGPSRRYFAADVTEPFELAEGGVLPVPRRPGLGVTPRADRLADFRVDRAVVTR